MCLGVVDITMCVCEREVKWWRAHFSQQQRARFTRDLTAHRRQTERPYLQYTGYAIKLVSVGGSRRF